MEKIMSKVANMVEGKNVKSVKIKDGSKKLKVKFHDSSPHEVALKRMK